MSKRTRRGCTKIAIAYLRASTEVQKLGPEAQRASIEAWAAREGVTVAAWHLDQGVSGGTDIADRAGLVAALTDLRVHGAGVLVVAKRDRLARDVVIAAMVERGAAASGAMVVSAAGEGNGNSPADAFMRTMLDGAAAYERALIRARTCAALAAKKARGERAGGVPFGFILAADGVHIEIDAAEQVVIATVLELRAAGMSIRGIVAALASRGFVSRVGRPFTKGSIENVLARGLTAAA